MSSSTDQTRQVVAGYVAALQRGDVAALRAAFAPDGTWTLRGDLPVAGTWTGPDEIFDGFLAQVIATLDPTVPVRQVLHRIIAEGEWAVAEWTSHARAKSGVDYVNDYAVVFRIEEGLIREVTEFCDTTYMKRVLFDHGG
ncbi:MAG: nuclear transport factor 2 family protein [Frankia sp.]